MPCSYLTNPKERETLRCETATPQSMVKRMKQWISLIYAALLVCTSLGAFADADIVGFSGQFGTIWYNDCDTLDNAADSQNVSLYEIPDDQREPFYDDFTTLQRSGVGEAYVVYEIPYINSASVTTHHLANDLGDFAFAVSYDAEEWTDVEAEADTLEAEGKWTMVNYRLKNLSGMKYLKLIWPETQNWWTPLVSLMTADVDKPKAEKVVIESADVLEIPMYDSVVYPVDAYVADQMGKRMEFPVELKLKDSTVEGLEITADGTVEISHEYPDGGSFTLVASAEVEGAPMTAEKTVTLKAALLGDLNGDLAVDRADLDLAVALYGRTQEEPGWQENRLADINKDGKIDIIDIAYLAKQVETEDRI